MGYTELPTPEDGKKYPWLFEATEDVVTVDVVIEAEDVLTNGVAVEGGVNDVLGGAFNIALVNPLTDAASLLATSALVLTTSLVTT